MQSDSTKFYTQCDAAEAAAREGKQDQTFEALKEAQQLLQGLCQEARKRMETQTGVEFQDYFQRTVTLCRSWITKGKPPNLLSMVSSSPAVSSNFTVLPGTGNYSTLR